MKRSIFLLCMLLLTLCLYNEKAEAKVQGENQDEIVWEKDGDSKSRSILPIAGYVENGIVSIYLYTRPEMLKISIIDQEGNPIYQNIYTSKERLEIDLRGASGSFEIIVEYDELLFKGELRF